MNTPVAAIITLKAMLHRPALSIIPGRLPIISFVGIRMTTGTMYMVPARVSNVAVRSTSWFLTVGHGYI